VSVERLIAAPHVQVILTRSPSTAKSSLATVPVLLEEGVCVA
jgi:hypothetical protein